MYMLHICTYVEKTALSVILSHLADGKNSVSKYYIDCTCNKIQSKARLKAVHSQIVHVKY